MCAACSGDQRHTTGRAVAYLYGLVERRLGIGRTGLDLRALLSALARTGSLRTLRADQTGLALRSSG